MQSLQRPPSLRINLISCETMSCVSDIKLIRTNTTFDFSQKVEKGIFDIMSLTLFRFVL